MENLMPPIVPLLTLQAMQEISPAILSPFEILRLVGFATGAALHLYLSWLLYHRYGIRRAESSLLGLGLSIGFWHLGNFAAAIYELVEVSGRFWWLKSSNVLAYVALAFLPPLLAHAHFRVWRWFDPGAPVRFFKPLIILGYVPLLVLPWVIINLLSGPYLPPEEKLSQLLLPFILWIVFIFIECALIDWWLARRLMGKREKRFFQVFGVTLASIGALFFLTFIVGAREWGMTGRYLDLTARLSSLAPTTIIAYYIYRYRYLELVIRQSFVYAIMAAIIMMVYIFGIRRLSIELEIRYGLRADIIESLLILVVILLAGPLRRLTDRYLQRLFAREVGLYRELVAQVGVAASNYGELAKFIDFAEKRLCDALELEKVSIIPKAAMKDALAIAGNLAEERQSTEIEDRSVLISLDALACYPLWREGRVVGLMLVRGTAQSLGAEKREVLMVLAGHIAVAIENCRLLEDKVRLERRLAQRERLASLGQMAATVAHEVKNPLSSIKSIVQVMREDNAVSREYGRDLELISGEVDRLNSSVSQLLSFSRPAVVESSSSPLSRIIENVVSLTSADAAQCGAMVRVETDDDPVLTGEKAPALQESLINLVLNSFQAFKSDSGSEVRIESRINGAGKLHISVTDDGPGISRDLRDRIFEPFFTTKQRGTGLGLAIVQRRLAELDGTIGLTSPVAGDRGTRFDLIFPI